MMSEFSIGLDIGRRSVRGVLLCASNPSETMSVYERGETFEEKKQAVEKILINLGKGSFPEGIPLVMGLPGEEVSLRTFDLPDGREEPTEELWGKTVAVSSKKVYRDWGWTFQGRKKSLKIQGTIQEENSNPPVMLIASKKEKVLQRLALLPEEMEFCHVTSDILAIVEACSDLEGIEKRNIFLLDLGSRSANFVYLSHGKIVYTRSFRAGFFGTPEREEKVSMGLESALARELKATLSSLEMYYKREIESEEVFLVGANEKDHQDVIELLNTIFESPPRVWSPSLISSPLFTTAYGLAKIGLSNEKRVNLYPPEFQAIRQKKKARLGRMKIERAMAALFLIALLFWDFSLWMGGYQFQKKANQTQTQLQKIERQWPSLEKVWKDANRKLDMAELETGGKEKLFHRLTKILRSVPPSFLITELRTGEKTRIRYAALRQTDSLNSKLGGSPVFISGFAPSPKEVSIWIEKIERELSDSAAVQSVDQLKDKRGYRFTAKVGR